MSKIEYFHYVKNKIDKFRHLTFIQYKIETLLTIDERGSKMLETVFSIVICYQLGDKWQSKTLFLTILSTFVDSINFFNCRLSGVFTSHSSYAPILHRPRIPRFTKNR